MTGLVVLNPGHRKYLKHSNEEWRYQRPLYVGTTDVYEDTTTPGCTAYLASLLTSRSSATVTSIKRTRDNGNMTIDPESGLAWATLGSRYFLKRLYPTLGATIWNKFPSGSPDRDEPDRSNLREYDEDIRSRPEYAKYINAETMISIHTDGSDDTTVRGSTVITNTGDANSFALATSIQCYMGEQITQIPSYATFPIRQIRSGNKYGEVREATMTTALIEVGFHTNSEDSNLIRGSAFRAAAMKGVEKGYRMYKEGKPCAAFSVAPAGNSSGPKGTDVPMYYTFTGEPREPLKVIAEKVHCADGYTCYNGNKSVKLENGQLSWKFECGTGGTGNATHTYRAKIYDADGIYAAPVESTVTCTAP